MSDRRLPGNVDAERSVLGALLLGHDDGRSVADLVTKRLPSPTDPGYFDWSWGFYLTELGDGGTRLVIRVRAATTPGLAMRLLGVLVFEPVHFTMEQRMLLGIKRRVEATGGHRPALDAGAGSPT